MNITLREVTMDTFHECLRLSVTEDQKGFVASNMYALAEAKADGAFEGHITHFGPDVVFCSPNPAGQPAGCNGVCHWILTG
jgi:diamine N-acetyltransferase